MKRLFSILLCPILLNGCIGVSKTQTADFKAENTKKTGIRNTIFASALLLNYPNTATAQTTEIDFNTLNPEDYKFSSLEVSQMEETRLALEKEGLLTPEAKYSSVMDTAILIYSPEIKPGYENEVVDDMDLGLPPLPRVSTEQEANTKRNQIESTRDDFYTNLSRDIKGMTNLELENLRANLNSAILASEQLKEYIYQLPPKDKDLLLESTANSVQLRILALLEIRKRGLSF